MIRGKKMDITVKKPDWKEEYQREHEKLIKEMNYRQDLQFFLQTALDEIVRMQNEMNELAALLAKVLGEEHKSMNEAELEDLRRYNAFLEDENRELKEQIKACRPQEKTS